MLHGLGLAGCLFAGVPVPQTTLEHARANQEQGARYRDTRMQGRRTRTDSTQRDRAQGDRTQGNGTQGDGTRGDGTRGRRRRAIRTRSGRVQDPRPGPAPIIAGDRPPPAHPERLVPDQPWTEAEREIWNELRDVLVWPL